MEQETFNKIVDMLPYIVFGGASLGVLLILGINWIMDKMRK